MTSKLLESVSSKVGETWAAQLFTPAHTFWLLTAAAWISVDAWDTGSRALAWVTEAGDVPLVLVAIAALLLTAASNALVRRVTLPVLRALEGYWPRPLAPLRARLVARVAATRDNLQQEWQELAGAIDQGTADSEHRARFVNLDEQLRRYPSPQELMPTRIGNILRASETLPRAKYDLEAVNCWVHVWLLLPADVRAELQAARDTLDSAVTLLLWSALTLLWVVWFWWAPFFALAAVMIVYWLVILPAARVWADQVDAVVDLYRTSLYEALRLPLPCTPAAERDLAEFVNEYLLRGSDGQDVQLQPPRHD